MFDVVFTGGQVIDGTGSPATTADIGIKDDRITAIGDLSDESSLRWINVQGKVITPGFIDVHTHDDRTVLSDPMMTPKVTQGVTTVVSGNCGISLAPMKSLDSVPVPLNLLGTPTDYAFRTFSDYIKAVESSRPNTNIVPLVGHSTLRVNVMDQCDRQASQSEIEQMKALLIQSLQEGAAGFSSGLAYPTAIESTEDEVVQLAKCLKDFGVVYTTHLRDEFEKVLDALTEAFDTADSAEIPVIISHHKCAGPENWGRTEETLPLIEKAAERQEVSMDCYPYTAGSSALDPKQIADNVPILITWSETHPEMTGLLLTDIARQWQCDIHEAGEKLQPAGAVYFSIDEQDMQNILAHDLCMVGSDGLPHDKHPHPRLYGTFPRVLGRYSRELNLFNLEQAVHKMTGLPAKKFRLHERGVLKVGHFADLVVFDPQQIKDLATFESPCTPAEGIEHVMLNGQFSLFATDLVYAGSGRVLKNQYSTHSLKV